MIVLTGFVINELKGGQDGHYLAFLILVILGVGLLRALLMLGRRFISGKQALAVEWDMRDALYARLLRLSFGYYDRHQTGQLMSRATVDLQTIRFFLGYGLIFFAQHVITIVCVTAVLFFYEWKLALIALAITPVLIGVAYRYSHVSHPVLRDVQQKLGEVATVSEESIVGIHIVKSFAQEEQAERRFRKASDDVFEASVRANTQRSLYVPLLTFLPMLAQAGVLLAAGHYVVQGDLTIGGFFAFNLLLMMLVMPLRMLGMWVGQAQRATASGERFFEVIDEPEEISDVPTPPSFPTGPGRDRPRGGRVRVRPRAPGARGDRPRDRGGQHDRADRRVRLGKDDARLARAAFLRHAGGEHHDRRHRRARRDAAVAAPRGRRHLPGSVPLLRERPRQHRLRRAGRPSAGWSRRQRAPRRRTRSSRSYRTATTP